MPVREYYNVNLTVDMTEEEIGMLEDRRSFCNIEAASFHTSRNTIEIKLSEPQEKIALAMIANWLSAANLSEEIATIQKVTEYSTGVTVNPLKELLGIE